MALALISTGSAMACEFQAAQFMGAVKNYREIQKNESVTECFYQIEFTQFNPSAECPLVEGEATTAQFQDYSCSMKDGDAVSGVLGKKGSFVFIGG
jgi:hypothetical protein